METNNEPVQYASFLRRGAALFLDGLILCLPALVVNHLLPIFGNVLLWFVYAPFLESSAIRATIGKKLMGIQVADLSGGRISFRSALLRALVKLLSPMMLFIPYLMALFTERRQALHDLAAETVVVYGRAEIPVVDAWKEVADEVFQLPPSGKGEASRLSDLERLQSLYERGALSKEEFESEKRKILGG